MKLKKIVIFGSGGHAFVVLSEIIKAKKFKIIGVVDDYFDKKKINLFKYYGVKYLGNLNKFSKSKSKKNIFGFVAVGDNKKREEIVKKVSKIIKNIRWATIISKDAIISTNVKIGEGTIIVSGSVVNFGTIIKKHCLINTNSSIDHENYFESFSSSGPSVTTGGNVKVFKGSHLGISSTIKQGIIIGKNTIIGGQTFINKNCDSNSMYFGIPGKKVGSRHKFPKQF